MEGVRLKSALPSWKITVPSAAIFFDMALKLAATPAKTTSYKTNAAMHQNNPQDKRSTHPYSYFMDS